MSSSLFHDYQKKIKEIEQKSSDYGDITSKNSAYTRSSSRSLKDTKGKITSNHTAFERIVSLSKTRDRCSKEIRDRLLREDFSEKDIDEAIQRSFSCGLIDDKRFADVYARSKSRSLWGPRLIEHELSRRNLSVDMLDEWPEEYGMDDVSLVRKAHELLDHRPPHSKHVQASAYNRLLRKGYPQPIAYQVSKEWAAAHSE